MAFDNPLFLGGAVIAGITGVAAFFLLGGQPNTKKSNSKASKKAPKKSKKSSPPKEVKESEPINTADFIADYTDSDSEAEKTRAARNKKKAARKKKAKKAESDTVTSESEVSAPEMMSKKMAGEGWETVSYKKRKSFTKQEKSDQEAEASS